MTDVVINSMRYAGIEKMPSSQLEHMVELIIQATHDYNALIDRISVARILYNGKTYLEQLDFALLICHRILISRKV